MVTYVWIGLGGAIGSIGRAWLALAVARITGPQFPWGTILINIVGSFIIGFFGALTANDSRFAVPTDARAFVMVGICGGFTTFSSFSLQTLELARDGRVAQALGNIGLSVVLCLAAVAIGHYAAAAIPQTQSAAKVPGSVDQGRVVVAVMDRPDRAESLLQAATRFLELMGGGRLKALAVRMPPAATIMPTEEVLTAQRAAQIRAQEEDWAGQLRTIAEAAAPRAVRHGVRLAWTDVEGDAAEMVIAQSRQADAIVIARPGPRDTQRMHDCLYAALFDTGCPVLLVPPGFDGPLGRIVAIAWKDDERAAKAVRTSLPILRNAQQVHVLRANAAAEVPSVLTEHGIAAQPHIVVGGDGSVGDRLLQEARRLGADLLVMGAFSHAAWRERLFGGVTRTMFAKADLPLLMRH